MPRRNWDRSELILALDLYCRLPFGKFHRGNSEIIGLASRIRRTPSAVALKLTNFASLDPTLQARGISGMSHGSHTDAVVWNEFFGQWEALAEQAATLRSAVTGESIEVVSQIPTADLPPPGRERDAVVKIRVGQEFFRRAVLAAYEFKCCITGLTTKELLNASHIVPWAADPKNRLNPQNGLCLNALHDRAFDRYLIALDEDFRVVISKKLKQGLRGSRAEEFFLISEGKRIALPTHFGPLPQFLAHHRERLES